jgi:hypothetical protein
MVGGRPTEATRGQSNGTEHQARGRRAAQPTDPRSGFFNATNDNRPDQLSR